MADLKNNFLALLLFFALGCQTQNSFKIQTFTDGDRTNDLHVVKIDSNRIRQECYFMNATEENKWRYQYLIYLLDDKNEVVSAMYPRNQEKNVCQEHLEKVEKIFVKSAQITLCLRDDLTRQSTPKEYHDFGKLGKHPDVYDALTFDSICNEKECYSINHIWTNSCPGFKKILNTH